MHEQYIELINLPSPKEMEEMEIRERNFEEESSLHTLAKPTFQNSSPTPNKHQGRRKERSH